MGAAADRDDRLRAVDRLWQRYDAAISAAVNAPDLAHQNEALDAMLHHARTGLPDAIDADRLRASMRERLASFGLEILSLEVSEARSYEFHRQRQVRVVATGPNAAVFAAVGAQRSDTPMRRVSALVLERVEGATPPRLEVEFVLDVFGYVAEGDAP